MEQNTDKTYRGSPLDTRGWGGKNRMLPGSYCSPAWWGGQTEGPTNDSQHHHKTTPKSNTHPHRDQEGAEEDEINGVRRSYAKLTVARTIDQKRPQYE